jgi:polysaccharide biosynthesis PFTS motif protein
MRVPMFFNSVQLDMSDELILLELQKRSNSAAKYLYFIKSFFSGVVAFFFLVFRILWGAKRREQIHILFSLSSSQIRSLQEIREFLVESRFALGISAHHILLIENRSKKQESNGNTLLVRDSMYWLYLNTMNRHDKLRCVRDILIDVLRSVLSFRLIRVLLLKQFIIDKHIFLYASKFENVLTLSTTQSQLQRLPLSFYLSQGKGLPRYMFWYSDNSWVFDRSNQVDFFDHSRYKRDFIDTHFCWSQEWKVYLESFDMESMICATDSIMFYKNQLINSEVESRHDLVIFDVTPGVSLDEYEFYSESMLTSFYQGIKKAIEKSKSPSVNVSIKNKRDMNHELDSWAKLNGATLLNPNSNLYELISSSRVVLGLPLVSPVRIAKELNIPCAYFYPRGNNEWVLPSSYADIPIIREESDLSDFLSKNFLLLKEIDEQT